MSLAITPQVGGDQALTLPSEMVLQLPREYNFELSVAKSEEWLSIATVTIALFWPDSAPLRTHALFWLKDRDNFWHQTTLPGELKPGETNLLEVAFHSGAQGWRVPDHSPSWHHRVRLNPQSVGFRLFSENSYTGTCVIVAATAAMENHCAPPVISHPRALVGEPGAFELYEARFNLPDRYANPFDPAQIDVWALVADPAGNTNRIDGFYYQAHYRLEDELGEPVEPVGAPEWRIRYCPRQEGRHLVSLFAKDRYGEAELRDVLEFKARKPAPDGVRFVRVSQRDTRFFELDDGSFLYPIGHNTRSAVDDRMDDKFPWRFRKAEGSTAYRRYFKRMREAGENLAEVWMSAWSQGLEWTEGVGGYHGAGDYHMGNAWELDQTLRLAMHHKIYINLVLNYHGRISSWCDPEWHLHPYNRKTPGGWLDHPMQFFSDSRAIEMQKRFCRYTQARWGWCPAIFGYELCSEINLTGDKSHHKTHFEPEVVEWCRVIGGYIKEIDPYKHLVCAHVSNDYKFLNPALCKLDEMDFNALDAYHHGAPERIISLISESAQAGAEYNKPILITEFGGSAMAAGLEHLKCEQHAAIWSAACIPISGTPMFWWWQIVDEENLYTRYAAVRGFLRGVDMRNPESRQVEAVLRSAESGGKGEEKRFGIICVASAESARGYIYAKRFARYGGEPITGEHLQAEVGGMQSGLFRVEFFETAGGGVVRRFDTRAKDGCLTLPVPCFEQDCAFRVALLKPVAE